LLSLALAHATLACSGGDDDSEPESAAGTNGDTSGSGAASGAAGTSGSAGTSAGTGGGAGTSAGTSGASGTTGDAGSGPMGDASTIDPLAPIELDDKTLSSLTKADAKELCTNLSALTDTIANEEDVARLGCVLFASVFSGVGGTFDALACEAQVQSCLINDSGIVSTMRCDVDGLLEAVMGCELTVGQYRQCAIASAERLALWIDTFSCEYLANPGVISMLAGLDMSSSSLSECAPVMAACPGLFDEGGGEPAANGCDDTCGEANDDFCDDGGPGSLTDLCALGTDCTDCGPRM